MWVRHSALLAAVAVTGVLAACGEGSDGEPKRTVDARTEALRFFAPDTPFVALVDSSPTDGAAPADTLDSLWEVGAVSAFAKNDLRFISEQGIHDTDLAGLLESSDPALESEESQIAVGVTPSGRPNEDALAVVVTSKPDEAAEAVRRAASQSGMTPAGTYDQAQLYTGESAAMAVRDGVILLAPTAGRLRAAIDDRDSGDDSHLDDSHVDAVLDAAPADAPLVAFFDAGELAKTDPGVSALTAGTGIAWLDDIGDAELAIVPGDPTEVTLTAEIGAGDEAEVPLAEEPQAIELTQDLMKDATTGEFAVTSGFHDALLALAPATLTVSATDDEVRARITTSR